MVIGSSHAIGLSNDTLSTVGEFETETLGAESGHSVLFTFSLAMRNNFV